MEISLVCCDQSPANLSQVVTASLGLAEIESRLLHSEEQNLPADQAKGLHLAAAHETHGEVTYLQEVLEGGFFVYVGEPSALQEHWFGPGSWVAFNDDRGSGHASKVGPQGCKRIFRLLRGQLDR